MIVHSPVGTTGYELRVDASDSGLGAVLVQKRDPEEYVIAFASLTLTAYEKNYSVTEKECLALTWAVKHFRYYLEGNVFRIVTDHSALVWLMNHKDPSSRLIKWALILH